MHRDASGDAWERLGRERRRATAVATAAAKAAVRPATHVRRRSRRLRDLEVDVQVGGVREGALSPSSADVATVICEVGKVGPGVVFTTCLVVLVS